MLINVNIADRSLGERMPPAYIHGRRMGQMMARALLKILIIIFIALQLATIHPFLSLIVIFIGYFSLPTEYSTDRPYQSAEAWFRFLFGFWIPFAIWAVLTNKGALLGSPGATFGMMINPYNWIIMLTVFPVSALVAIALAFFPTFPARVEPEGGGFKLGIFVGGKRRDISAWGSGMMSQSETVGRLLFIVFMNRRDQEPGGLLDLDLAP